MQVRAYERYIPLKLHQSGNEICTNYAAKLRFKVYSQFRMNCINSYTYHKVKKRPHNSVGSCPKTCVLPPSIVRIPFLRS